MRAYRGIASGAALLLGVALVPAALSAQQGPPPGPPPAGAPPGGAPPAGRMPNPAIMDQIKLLKPLPAPAPGSRLPSPDPRNFEGIYTSERVPFSPQALPLTAKAAADRDLDRKRTAEGKPTGGLAAICRPTPTFNIGSDLFPGEIVQTPTQVIFLNEEHRTRRDIYLDREHPKDLTPSYFGDSVGHWEGDTLVVDTIGFNGRDRNVSPEAHIVSRVRKIDGGQRLEVETTTIDPLIYTAPVVRTTISRWNPEVQMLEFQCEENMEGAMEGLNLSQ